MRMSIAVAAAIAATAISFAVATAANRPTPPPKPSAADREMVKELKALTRSIKTLNSAVGSPGVFPGGLRGDVSAIKKLVEATNSSISSPVVSVRGDLHGIDNLLKDICRAVRPTVAGYPCL